MSISEHSIQPLTSADLPTLADFLVAAKLQLAINRFLFKDWPNESAQRAIYTNSAERSIKDPEDTCLKVVDGSGEMVGYIVLTHRKAETEAAATNDANANQDEQQKIGDAFNPEVLPMVTKMIEEVHAEMKGIEHIQITHMYVRPSNRNQGIGLKLVQRSIDMAKAAELPLFVGTEPAAHDFFLRRGFTDTTHFDIDLSKWAPACCGWGLFRLSGMVMSP